MDRSRAKEGAGAEEKAPARALAGPSPAVDYAARPWAMPLLPAVSGRIWGTWMAITL